MKFYRQFKAVCQIIDQGAARGVRVIVKKWCSLTGKSNFTLARLMLTIPTIVIAALILVRDQPLGWKAIGCTLWMLSYLVDLYKIHVIESAIDWEEGKVALSRELYNACTAIIFYKNFCWGFLVFWILVQSPLTFIWIFLIFSYYAALEFQPPGTSAWARAKEKVAAFFARPVLVPVRN